MGFLRQKFFSERVSFALSLSPATIQEKDRNYRWSLTRMRSRKRPNGKTMEGGHLRELQKLNYNS